MERRRKKNKSFIRVFLIAFFATLAIIAAVICFWLFKKEINENNDIHIFTCICDNTAPHCAEVMASVLANASKDRKICFHGVRFESENLGQDHIDKLNSMKKTIRDFDLDFCTLSSESEKRLNEFKNEWWSNGIFIKLFAPEIFENSKNIHKIIWLDDDVTVLGNICELYDMDLDGKSIGGVNVANYYSKYDLNHKRSADYWITAGIMVFNLDGMRKHNLQEKLLEKCEYYSKNVDKIRSSEDVLGGAEEWAFSVIPKEYVFVISYRWSVMAYMAKYFGEESAAKYLKEDEVKNAEVIHFCDAKPWKPADVANKMHPDYYNHWKKYFDMTPYAI